MPILSETLVRAKDLAVAAVVNNLTIFRHRGKLTKTIYI